MKVAVITDTHWGVRNDNGAFLEYFKMFYENVFFPTLKERGITHVLHLGDLTDRRKYINYVTAKHMEEVFMRPLWENGIQLDVIAGNHDTYYKNTNEVNSLIQLYGQSKFDNVNIHWNDCADVHFDDCQILMVPWICQDNSERIMKQMKETKAQIVMGHFEILGFEMMRGHLCDHGMDKKIFKKFDSVYSGHFHHPSTHENITYLGAPYEMTWTDYEGKRGFHILDTETREMEFVANPYRMFHKLFYNDDGLEMEDIVNIDTSDLTNTYIKVIVSNKTNPYIFDLFLDRLQQSGAADIKVVEDHQNLDILDENELIDEAQDTRTILNQYIDSIETKVDKDKVKLVISDLYNEAINL